MVDMQLHSIGEGANMMRPFGNESLKHQLMSTDMTIHEKHDQRRYEKELKNKKIVAFHAL
jgi:hypothetical protein